MAKFRETPCLYYIAKGECKKGRKALHNTYCQHCDKYVPRAKERHLNKKIQKLYKVRKDEYRI